ncbi:adenylylsulfate kinase [Scleroderma citrinum]
MATNVTFHPGSVSASERSASLKQRGVTIWLTGLSASGKSTVACALEKMLLHRGKFTYRLDGDNIRLGLNKDLGFDAISQTENVRRIGEVAKLLTDACCVTIVAFISPFRVGRETARKLHEDVNLGFLEVFVDAPLSVVEQRDPKGLYKMVRAGEIQNFPGISAPYEVPENPDVHLRTAECDVTEAVKNIIGYLEAHHYL